MMVIGYWLLVIGETIKALHSNANHNSSLLPIHYSLFTIQKVNCAARETPLGDYSLEKGNFQ